MAVSIDALKEEQQDYYVAKWENNELVVEPFCHCGSSLDEDFFCRECNRECDCTFFVCSDPQAFSVVEKLISGSPSFRNFKASLLDEQ